MSLLPIPETLPLLVCPRCRGPLTRAPGVLACGDASCSLGGDYRFGEAGGRPVLLDPEWSTFRAEPAAMGAGPPRLAAERKPRLRWLRRLFVPYNRVAAEGAAGLLTQLHTCPHRPRLLIIGGGLMGNGAESLYQDPAVDVIAFDLFVSSYTQFVADGHAIPLPNESIDAVWIQAVLEHVLDPRRVVDEIHRVLVPGGRVYAETPFLQGVHEGAHDFTRFTESGHRWLFRRFESMDSGVVAGPFLSLQWAIGYAAGGLFRSKTIDRLTRLAFFWLPWLDPLVPEPYSVDGASCVFFLGRKRRDEMRPQDIARHYKGAQAPPRE